MTPTDLILSSNLFSSFICSDTSILSLTPVTFGFKIPADFGSVIAAKTIGIELVDCTAVCAVLVAIA